MAHVYVDVAPDKVKEILEKIKTEKAIFWCWLNLLR